MGRTRSRVFPEYQSPMSSTAYWPMFTRSSTFRASSTEPVTTGWSRSVASTVCIRWLEMVRMRFW